jgi:hypothetical protein
MELNKGLKKYVDELREKRIKEQDKKIMGLRRLKYDDETRQALIDNAKYLSKIINRRYRELEKAGIENKSYAYKRTQSETGLNRYTTSKRQLEKLTSEELYDLNVDLYSKYASSTTSVSYVEQTIQTGLEKAVETLQTRLKYSAPNVAKSLNVDDFRTFINLGGGQFLNEAKDKGYGSTNLIEDWQSVRLSGVSDKEFIREWKRFTHEFDKDKFRRNIRALKSRKKK